MKLWKQNIIAGLIVGIVSLPLSMSFSIASGVKPEQGLYTSIIAGIIVGLFGGTRVQIAGPTGAFVVLLSTIVAKYGVQALQAATLIAGGIIFLMGIFKLGNVIRFLPYPVIVGFTSGIAFVIFVSQWKDFFGLSVDVPLDSSFVTKFSLLISNLPQARFGTTLLSIFSLIILIYNPLKKIPAPLVAMVVATVVQYFFCCSVTIGSVFGEIPRSLPSFSVPPFSIDLLWPALSIALLGSVESLLSATAADAIMGTKHNPNKELKAQGLANIVAPFFCGFASTGAFARTMTNIRHGGSSPIAAISHSIFLLAVLLVFAPLASYIPFSVLSAILCVVSYHMSDIPQFVALLRSPWYDIIVLFATLCLTIFVDLIVAIGVGVLLSGCFALIRLQKTTGTLKGVSSRVKASSFSQGVVYSLEGPFFFGVTSHIERAFEITHTEPKYAIFCFEAVPFIDATGLNLLKQMIDRHIKRNIPVYLCSANKRVSKKLHRLFITSKAVEKKIFDNKDSILKHLERGT